MRPDDRPIFTWNLMPVPRELIPGLGASGQQCASTPHARSTPTSGRGRRPPACHAAVVRVPCAWANPGSLRNRLDRTPGGREMAKALVITEKPSVARDIADALGGFREEDGYFESDDLRRHLRGRPSLRAARARGDRRQVQALDARRAADPARAVRLQGQEGPDRSRSARSSSCSQRDDVDSIVNACDAGREGELIFREIVEYLGAQQPIRRLWLQSMTDDAIRDGFQRLRPRRGARRASPTPPRAARSRTG